MLYVYLHLQAEIVAIGYRVVNVKPALSIFLHQKRPTSFSALTILIQARKRLRTINWGLLVLLGLRPFWSYYVRQGGNLKNRGSPRCNRLDVSETCRENSFDNGHRNLFEGRGISLRSLWPSAPRTRCQSDGLSWKWQKVGSAMPNIKNFPMFSNNYCSFWKMAKL